MICVLRRGCNDAPVTIIKVAMCVCEDAEMGYMVINVRKVRRVLRNPVGCSRRTTDGKRERETECIRMYEALRI